MYRKETLIVITNYTALVEEYADPTSRMRWGVVANPILNNGNYILPLGWETELTEAGIAFEVKEVDFYYEEL